MSRSTNLFANQPWKILLISSSSKIKYSNGFIIIKNSNEIKVPLSNIAVIVFEDNKSLISSVLLSKLIENNIRLIFINDKHQPIGEVSGYNLKSNNLDKITLQFNWGEEQKGLLWQKIIKNKLNNQFKILKKNSIAIDRIFALINEVESNDSSNVEGLASRLYFKALFGKAFIRHHDDPINEMLNYGYAIIHAYIARALYIYGYNLSLGIKHIGKRNPFNLSYDFIEPFRPMVDDIVYKNKDSKLYEIKSLLIQIPFNNIKYGKIKGPFHRVIFKVIDDYLAFLNKNQEIKRDIEV